MRYQICIAKITTVDANRWCMAGFAVILFKMSRTDQTVVLLLADMHFMLAKVSRFRTTLLLLLMMVQRTPWC